MSKKLQAPKKSRNKKLQVVKPPAKRVKRVKAKLQQTDEQHSDDAMATTDVPVHTEPPPPPTENVETPGQEQPEETVSEAVADDR